MTRTVATLAVALVLVLAVLAASPELHERIHGHGPHAAGPAPHEGSRPDQDQPDDEDGCVVTLFAQGIVLAATLFLLVTRGTLRLPDFAFHDGVPPAAPRYLRLPTQAPPLGLS